MEMWDFLLKNRAIKSTKTQSNYLSSLYDLCSSICSIAPWTSLIRLTFKDQIFKFQNSNGIALN